MLPAGVECHRFRGPDRPTGVAFCRVLSIFPPKGFETTCQYADTREARTMTISVQDKRLLAGKEQTLEKLRELELQGKSGSIIETAKAVMEESLADYRKSIRREDLTEEVREILREPRQRAGDALVRVYYTIKRQYAERRAAGEALTDQDKQVEEFLRNLSPGEYISASFPTAVSTLEKAQNFASQYLPEDVQKFSESALSRARETRNRIEQLGERALKAYSDLEEAREEAKSNYLAVREMTSAALRLEGQFRRLNSIAPPVSDVMSPE